MIYGAFTGAFLYTFCSKFKEHFVEGFNRGWNPEGYARTRARLDEIGSQPATIN
jgi:hypothetical protein